MYSTIYWLTRLDGINGLFTSICICCVIILILAILLYPMLIDILEDGDIMSKKGLNKAVKWMVGIAIVSALISVFLPTKNEMILIYAGGKAYEYVQKDTSLQKLPYTTTEYLKVLLEKEIKDLKADKK